MNWNLIRKNLRVERTPLLATVLVSVLCYVSVPVVALIADKDSSVKDRLVHLQGVKRSSELFVIATVLSVFTTGITLPTLSGNALATERQERWAEFEFMLPVSRTRRTMVRLGVAAGLALILFAVQAVLFEAAIHVAAYVNGVELHERNVNTGDINKTNIEMRIAWTGAFLGLASGTLAGFGVAWLTTSLMRTAAVATAVALGVSLGLSLAILVLPQLYANTPPPLPNLLETYNAVMVDVGVAGLIGGTLMMLKRRTPVS